MAVTVLPHPLSPTSPRISPCSSENDTSSTALTTPSALSKYVLRFRTWRMFKELKPPETLRGLCERRRRFLQRTRRLRRLPECEALDSGRCEPPLRGHPVSREPPPHCGCGVVRGPVQPASPQARDRSCGSGRRILH